MRTFTNYYGPKRLIPEKKGEFVERALKILQYGGAMDVQTIELSTGATGLLLAPLGTQKEENNKHTFSYSYFEKRSWEEAVLDLETGDFQTGEVGYSTLGQVCYSVNLLREFYSVVPGVASLNGTSPFVEFCLGWMNYLFDEKWDNQRIYRIHALYQRLPNWRKRYCDREDSPAAKKLMECLARPYTASGEIDSVIMDRMWCDGVVSVLSTNIEMRPMRTVDFLNCASELSRYHGYEKDNITQDDRAYWWRPEGDVEFSEKMELWLRHIHGQYDEYRKYEQEIDVSSTLDRILTKCTETFHRPVLFSSFYWDCIQREQDRKVWAAVRQLEFIVKDAVKARDYTWLDRYCAVLANDALREKVLGF